MDQVEFECPECFEPLAVDSESLNESYSCEHCEHAFVPMDVVGRRAEMPSVPDPSLTPPASDAVPQAESSKRRLPEESLTYKPEVSHMGLERPSLRDTLYGRVDRDTTSLGELSEIATRLTRLTRLTVYTDFRVRTTVGMRLAGAAAVLVTLALLTAMGLSTGTWRWVLATVAYLSVTALLVWAGLRLLLKLPSALGARQLPGRAWKWLVLFAAVVTGAAAALTWGLSEATASLAVAGWPSLAAPRTAAPTTSAAPSTERADAAVNKGAPHVRVAGGRLYVPESFASEDGSFDLIMHFHGNTDVVEQSVAHAGINALVHTTNLGVGSGPYEARYTEPRAFDDALAQIAERVAKLGLRDAKIQRVALMSWSAGYGALSYILAWPRHRERVDAVLMLDSMHLKFRDEKEGSIHPASIKPFLEYARSASGGDKLFVLTHAQIRTEGYASTTESADALLGALGARRAESDVAPLQTTDETVLRTVPSNVRRPLTATSAAHLGNLHVQGYTGFDKEDHISHLIHMSASVLPRLIAHWKR